MPDADQSEADVLARRAEVWRERPLTREVYRRYFRDLAAELASGSRTLEIGGGSGIAREFLPGILVSDLLPSPFVDLAASAADLPLRDSSVDNLLMVDLLHHLPHPIRLFDEARRILRPGGRLLMIEPYISPVSRLVFRLGHPEAVDLRADPLREDGVPVVEGTGAFAANQAVPTILFGRDLSRFRARYPDLRVRKRALRSVFVYPLSGGFSGPCLLPRFGWRAAWWIERGLLPLGRLLAFRLLIVLEKEEGAASF